MILLTHLLLIAGAAILDFGPLGRQAAPFFSLTLGVVLVWGFSWFGVDRHAFRFALLLGLVFGLIGFLPILAWVLVAVGGYILTNFLKRRFFELSSFPLAILTLVLVSIWSSLVLGSATRSFELAAVTSGMIANAVFGVVIYYVLGIRFKFLQRWAGRRL